MDRRDVVQTVIDRRRGRTYLEIGVKKGKLFLQVIARKKIAVDPVLKISRKRKMKAWLRSPFNLFNEYFEMTSDEFFTRARQRLERLGGMDVVFIDGLHTHEQSWKDVLNSLRYLSPGGVILMHDCSPAPAAQATPAASREDAAERQAVPRAGCWSGDVWKTIVKLRAERDDLRIGVLDCDHGIGVILRGEPERRLSLSGAALEALGYDDLAANRRELLNLLDPERLGSWLSASPLR